MTLCIRLRLRPRRLWLGGSAPQMASSSITSTSSAVPRPLKNVFLKVIPESTRKEVTQIQRTRVLVIESKNSQGKICVFEVENCFAMGVRRY